jgi:hypothetical protein
VKPHVVNLGEPRWYEVTMPGLAFILLTASAGAIVVGIFLSVLRVLP